MKKRSKALTRIKRTILLLLILAALTSVFYFGYYQFQLPADTYGVIFTKINGWNHDLIVPAEFRIEWEGLIPFNLKIEKFTILPTESIISSKGELPSAEAYSAFLSDNPDFSYEYSMKLSYTVSPDYLTSLVSEEFLREDTLDDWLSDFNTNLTVDAAAMLREAASDSDYLESISYNHDILCSEFEKFLAEKYEYINIISVSPQKIKFPDFALYSEGRRQYFEMERVHSDIETESIEATTNRMAEETAKLELLEKYGALFSKYPELIDYYRIHTEDGTNLIPSIELPVLNNGN